MNKNSLSAILLFSGEKSVLDAIESVGFADEIIIIHDCLSGEGNIKILEKYKGKVNIFHKNLSSFSDQRNFGMQKVKSDWVLYLDADEIISEDLAKIIVKKIEDQKVDGYYIRRIDNFLGKTISRGELLNIYLMRLGRKNKGKWLGVVHEKWDINGATKKIKNPILHSPHPTLYNFLEEIDRYTTLRSFELSGEKGKVTWLSIVFYPFSKFILNYIFKMGFLEGNRGFVLSVIMSFHSFMARSKAYQAAHEQKLNPK